MQNIGREFLTFFSNYIGSKRYKKTTCDFDETVFFFFVIYDALKILLGKIEKWTSQCDDWRKFHRTRDDRRTDGKIKDAQKKIK